jgi:hypothetical protein
MNAADMRRQEHVVLLSLQDAAQNIPPPGRNRRSIGELEVWLDALLRVGSPRCSDRALLPYIAVDAPFGTPSRRAVSICRRPL